MEVKKITNEMREQLHAQLPQEALSKHPAKTFLTSIKAIYVVERLNDVFGVGSWQTRTEIVSIENNNAVVKCIFEIPEYGVYFETYGGHDDKDLGDALKGAATDALTKAASYLEIGIEVFKGLAKGFETKPNESTDVSKRNNFVTFDEIKKAQSIEELKAIYDRVKFIKSEDAKTQLTRELTKRKLQLEKAIA